jgi:hypothetical protein
MDASVRAKKKIATKSSKIRPSSIVPAYIWRSNQIGKQKVNHLNTQAKPISLNNALGVLYPKHDAIKTRAS